LNNFIRKFEMKFSKSAAVIFTSFYTLASFASGFSTSLKSFSYRGQIPHNAQTSCEQSLAETTREFVTSTHLQVTDSSCSGSQLIKDQGQTYQSDTFTITYLARAEVRPYLAIFGGRESHQEALPDSALFLTYSDCLRNLEAQRPIFAKMTQLPAVAAHCDAAEDIVNPGSDYFTRGFSLTLEGFGKPQKELYAYADLHTAGYPTTPSPELHEAAKMAVIRGGGQLTLSDSAHFFYYSDRPVLLTDLDLGLFSSLDECSMQIADAQMLFSKAGYYSVTAVCADTVINKSHFGELDLIASGNGSYLEDYAQTSPNYLSLDECLKDRSRLIHNHRSSGETVLGALCRSSGIGGRFVTTVYTAN
jgi:hypothetical protein